MPVYEPGRWINPDDRPDWCGISGAGRFAVPLEGGRFERHRHDDHELWFITEGKARIEVDGALRYVQSGDIVLTRAGEFHDVVEVYEPVKGFFAEIEGAHGWPGGTPRRRAARCARPARARRLPRALMRIAVTGSSGKLGTAAVERLRADGHEVLGLDLHGTPGTGFTRVDLADYGQVLDALLGVTARADGFDAVVHLAAVPVNGLIPDHTTFQGNVAISFNVLWAAMRAGIRRIVTASSITAMGFPFPKPPPYLPLDEEYVAALQHLRPRQGGRGGDGGPARELGPGALDHGTALHQCRG